MLVCPICGKEVEEAHEPMKSWTDRYFENQPRFTDEDNVVMWKHIESPIRQNNFDSIDWISEVHAKEMNFKSNPTTRDSERGMLLPIEVSDPIQIDIVVI